MSPEIQAILSSIFSATFLGAILRVATPILLPSLGALVSDRAGVINIGLEGIILTAAFTGATVGAYSQSAFLGAVMGLIAGVLTALLLAFFHLQLGGDLILGGVAINILGSAATVAIGFQLTGDHSGGTGLASVQLPTIDLTFLKGVSILYTIVGSQNLMTWVAFLSVILISWLLYRTPFGKHLRAVGENPDAAASVGINVRRVRYIALALSGLLAGMGGLHLSMGYLDGFTRDMSAGRGFIALVAPALGNGTPVGTMLSAVLFGVFDATGTRLGSARIPSQIPAMIPYVGTLVALVIYSLQRRRSIAARSRRFAQQLDQQADAPPA